MNQVHLFIIKVESNIYYNVLLMIVIFKMRTKWDIDYFGKWDKHEKINKQNTMPRPEQDLGFTEKEQKVECFYCFN